MASIVPIKLVQMVTTQEATGEWSEEPTEYKYKVFAELLSNSGSRSYDHRTELGQTKKFKTYFRDELDLNADWKIEFRGSRWTITNIELEKEIQFFWIITATKEK